MANSRGASTAKKYVLCSLSSGPGAWRTRIASQRRGSIDLIMHIKFSYTSVLLVGMSRSHPCNLFVEATEVDPGDFLREFFV